MKRLFPIFTVLGLLLAAENQLFAQALPARAAADSLKTATIKVKGITCASDLKSIAANVEKLKGVASCKPGKAAATTSFDIRFHPGTVSEKEIFAAIEQTAGCENPADRPYKVKF